MIRVVCLVAILALVLETIRFYGLLDQDDKRNCRSVLLMAGLIAFGLGACAWGSQTQTTEIAMGLIAASYFLVTRSILKLQGQRNFLRQHAQDLARNIDRLDDSATSKIASGESRFRDLAAVVPVGIFESDIEKRLVYVNKLMGEMTGLGARRTRKEGFREAIHPDDRTDVQLAWETALTDQTVFERVFRFVGENRDPIWVVCLSHPRFVNGIYAGHVGMFMDVTERKQRDQANKQLDEQTRRADRYESLSVLTSGIAHDFNNLLVPILGGADRLARELPDDANLKKLASELANSAKGAADLSAQMLAYSGTMYTGLDNIDLIACVTGTKETIEVANRNRFTIRYEVEGPPTLPLSSNAVQLRQALMNMVDNAIEAMPETDGLITIRCGRRNFSADELQGIHLGDGLQPGLLAFVEVEDNGEGISEENIARVLDPFFTTRFKGRGLGLAATAGIIRNLGGGLLLKSQTPGGTTMSIVFSLEKQTPVIPVSKNETETAASPGQRIILIIDDEAGVREFVGAMLEFNGFTPLEAAEGVVGIELFRQEHENLHGVILDLTMPQMDGEEVLDYLTEINPDVPVLITSGFAEVEVLGRLADRKICGFLAKPFREEELMVAVAKLNRQP